MRSILLGSVLGAALASAQIAQSPVAKGRNMTFSFSTSGSSYIGVGLAEVDSDRAKQLKLREEQGVELTHIEEDSPASHAGLKVHDVVLEYNGQRVEGMEQFARFVRETPANRDVKLTISREGAHQSVVVKVGQRKASHEPMAMVVPPMPNMAMETPRPFIVWANPRIGIDAEGIEGQLGQFFGVKEGVLVRSVAKNSAAEKAGLRAGDVITKVDGNPVATAADVTRYIRSSRGKKTFPLSIFRDRHEMTVNVTLDESQMENQQQGRGFYWWNNEDGVDANQELLKEGFTPEMRQFFTPKLRIIRL